MPKYYVLSGTVKDVVDAPNPTEGAKKAILREVLRHKGKVAMFGIGHNITCDEQGWTFKPDTVVIKTLPFLAETGLEMLFTPNPPPKDEKDDGMYPCDDLPLN